MIEISLSLKFMKKMNGQITIYATTGCPHCLHAKGTLRNLGLEFIEISLDKHPNVQKWLQEKTGKTSVPQIFFNNFYVGGNDKLQSAIKDAEEWQHLLKIVHTTEISNLFIPTSSEVEDSATFMCIPDPSADVVEDLVNSGITQSVRPSFWSRKHDRVFSGHQFVKWLSQTKGKSEDDSIEEGSLLLEKKFIVSVNRPTTTTTRLQNDPKILYRLNESSEVKALNAGQPKSCQISDANELAANLRKLILRLFNDFLSSDGKSVDYKAMKSSESFADYVSMAGLLQRVPVERLTENERKAFFINVYNAMVIHETAVNGPPSGVIGRAKFYANTKYVIGGLIYILNDVENGILRANKKGLISFSNPFGNSDHRKSISLTQVDPRIHFALNCGARSCPPIKIFTSEGIDDELGLATESYLEGDDGVVVNPIEKGGTSVMLSSLLRWYTSDFGPTLRDVVQWVADNLPISAKKDALKEALQKDNYKVSYLPYDWTVNSQA